MFQRIIENVSPFVRVVREITHHSNGQSIESYRESRPWVWGVILGLMVGFCIWAYTVAQVGAIGLN